MVALACPLFGPVHEASDKPKEKMRIAVKASAGACQRFGEVPGDFADVGPTAWWVGTPKRLVLCREVPADARIIRARVAHASGDAWLAGRPGQPDRWEFRKQMRAAVNRRRFRCSATEFLVVANAIAKGTTQFTADIRRAIGYQKMFRPVLP